MCIRDRRNALADALKLKNFEFNAHGVELNQRCESAAVLLEAEQGAEVWRRDPQLYVQPTTRPGAKLPHAWLVGQDGRRVSTLDLVGKGRFSLVTGIAGKAWVDAAKQMDLSFMRTVVIGGPGAQDAYCSWHAMREIDEAGALLVRPDGVVAWRQHRVAADVAGARASLEQALAMLLDRPSLLSDLA
jgi:2,4-dichlorophenol 6-monooxygenase